MTYVILVAEESRKTILVDKDMYTEEGYAPADYFVERTAAKVAGEIDVIGDTDLLGMLYVSE